LVYLIKAGFRSILSNKLMSGASVCTLVVCLVLIGAAVLFSYDINTFVETMEAQNEIVVYLGGSLTQGQIDQVGTKIGLIGNVEKYTFISKEQALEEMIQKIDGLDTLIGSYKDDNNLPDSYVVTIKDLTLMSDTVGRLNTIGNVIQVNAPTQIADILIKLKQMVNTFGIVIVAVLGLVALVIISNTVRVAVYARRREINIMKYVGATNFFIRMPFIVEGVILGLIASAISFFTVWAVYQLLYRWLATSAFSFISTLAAHMIPFSELAMQLFGLFILAGVGIGGLGSSIFVRRYLKV